MPDFKQQKALQIQKYLSAGGKVVFGKLAGGVNRENSLVQHFQKGAVVVSKNFLNVNKAYAVYGIIYKKWQQLGLHDSVLGLPKSDESKTPDNKGGYVYFQNGIICRHPKAGIYEVHGDIKKAWDEKGSMGGSLGYPTSDVNVISDGKMHYSCFQNGAILWIKSSRETKILEGSIYRKWFSQRNRYESLGLPVQSGDFKSNPYCQFEKGSIVYNKKRKRCYVILGVIHDEWIKDKDTLGLPIHSSHGRTATQHFENGSVYSSNDSKKAYVLTGEIDELYREKISTLGELKSGIQQGESIIITDHSKRSREKQIKKVEYCELSEGVIINHPEYGTHAVLGEIYQHWKKLGKEKSSLGYPIASELPAPGGNHGRYLKFVHGSLVWYSNQKVILDSNSDFKTQISIDGLLQSKSKKQKLPLMMIRMGIKYLDFIEDKNIREMRRRNNVCFKTSEVITDENGKFQLNLGQIFPVEIDAELFYANSLVVKQNLLDNPGFRFQGDKLAIKPTIEVELGATQAITGRVIHALSRQSIAGLIVRAYHYLDKESIYLSETQSNEQGDFKLEVYNLKNNDKVFFKVFQEHIEQNLQDQKEEKSEEPINRQSRFDDFEELVSQSRRTINRGSRRTVNNGEDKSEELISRQDRLGDLGSYLPSRYSPIRRNRTTDNDEGNQKQLRELEIQGPAIVYWNPEGVPSILPVNPLDSDENDPIKQSRIYGKVYLSNDRVLSDVAVDLYEKIIQSGSQLGSTKTNALGEYQISYQYPKNQSPNLIITASLNRKDETPMTGSTLIVEAQSEEEVDFEIDYDDYGHLSEFEELAEQIIPNIDVQNVDIISDSDIDLLLRQTQLNEEKLRYFIGSLQLHKNTQVDPELFYALVRLNIPLEAQSLFENKASQLRDLLKQAIQETIIPGNIYDDLDNIIRKLQTCLSQKILNESNVSEGSLKNLLDKSQIPVELQEKFLFKYQAHEGNLSELWESLQQEESFTTEAIQSLQFLLDIAKISYHHLPLISAINELKESKDLDSIYDLATWTVDDWEQELENKKITIPAEIHGDDEEEKRHTYAKNMYYNFLKTFPQAALIQNLSVDSSFDIENDVPAFLNEYKDFDLFKNDIDEYLEENKVSLKDLKNKEELAHKIKVLQRRVILNSDTDDPQALIILNKLGVRSSYEISQQSRQEFIDQYLEIGGESKLAQRIYERAQETTHLAQALILREHPELNKGFPTTYAVGVSRSLEDYFGNLDYCACEHCRSVLSPAAYFVDLLNMLKKIRVPGSANNALNVLISRRPDLVHLELSCDNTQTTLPYIDLVNELLEAAVIDMEDVNWSEHQSRQSAESLRAIPAYCRDDVYEKLRLVRYPWELPFNLWAETLREFMEAYSVNRAQLMDLLNPAGEKAALESLVIADEYLNLSDLDRDIICGKYFKQLKVLWGLSGSKTVTSQLKSIPILLRRSGLNYNDLEELLSTNYLNPERKSFIQFNQENPSDLDLAELKGATQKDLHQWIIFMRLQKKTGLSITVLDKTLSLLQINQVGEETLLNLALLHRIQQILQLDFEEVIIIFGNFENNVDRFLEVISASAEEFEQTKQLFPYELFNINKLEDTYFWLRDYKTWRKDKKSYQEFTKKQLSQRLKTQQLDWEKLYSAINNINEQDILKKLSDFLDLRVEDLQKIKSHFKFKKSDWLDQNNIIRLVQIKQQLNAWNIPINLAIQCSQAVSLVDKVVSDAWLTFMEEQYTENQWYECAQAPSDRIRTRKRDALVAYLLSRHEEFSSDINLYQHYLIDTQMDVCMQTSRIKQAVATVQLFLQRCLLGLEEHVKIKTDSHEEFWQKWQWMKNYRIWEANRKVFLYPENWIRPELRDNKTPLFKELESKLRQIEITSENLDKLYGEYLQGLENIAELKILSACQDDNNNCIYVFARNHGTPEIYYYRRLVDNTYWTGWEKMNLDIKSDDLLPIVANSRLYLFWPEVQVIEKKIKEQKKKFDEITFSYSHLENDRWEPKKTFKRKYTCESQLGCDFRVFYRPRNEIHVYIIERPNKTNFINSYNGKSNTPYHKIPIAFDCGSSEHKALAYYRCIIGSGLRGGLIRFGEDTSVKKASLNQLHVHHLFDVKAPEYKNQDVVVTQGGNIEFSPFVVNQYDRNLWIERVDEGYQIWKLDHVEAQEFMKTFNQKGIREFFSRRDWFKSNGWFKQYKPTQYIVKPYPDEKNIDFDIKAPASVYNWELFFHIPNLFASVLKNELYFSEAQRWQHRVFNPRIPLSENNSSEVWRFPPLAVSEGKSIEELLRESTQGDNDLKDQIAAWRKNPFNPHLIARFRNAAYQKYFVMSYLDNLIDWGDHLFRQDTMESINEAIQIYMLAAQILGEAPSKLAEQEIQAKSYEDVNVNGDFGNVMVKLEDNLVRLRRKIRQRMSNETDFYHTPLAFLTQRRIDLFNEASAFKLLPKNADDINQAENDIKIDKQKRLVVQIKSSENVSSEIENTQSLVPIISQASNEEIIFANSENFEQALPLNDLYFGVPVNDKLLDYWKDVGDRLYKIRHCMNINGVERQLALFQPPIDPEMLVKAMASGLSLSDILRDLQTPLPKYRFQVLLQKAFSYCQDLRSFSDRLLATLEKQDVEEFAYLKTQHSLHLNKLVQNQKQMLIDEANANLECLKANQDTVNIRHDYYKNIAKLNGYERTQLTKTHEAKALNLMANAYDSLASVMAMIPQLHIGFFSGTSTGGIHAYNATKAMSGFLNLLSSDASYEGNLASIKAGHERRWNEWKLQEKLAKSEIKQIEKQKALAEIRIQVAKHDLNIQCTQTEKTQAELDYLQNKYTNSELYQWFLEQLDQLHKASYKMAHDLAKQAEKSLHFERGTEIGSFIQPNYWDKQKHGMFSGEMLYQDLKRMELAAMEKHERDLELQKNISLAFLDHRSLWELQETGQCIIKVPEALFDIDHPGHYKRRLKSVQVSMPCISGPQGEVHASLTLIKSWIRHEAKHDNNSLIDVDKTPCKSIAISHAQQDSGLFQLNFQDERYLPFEGSGAISEWLLQLPQEFRSFDYKSIADVILHFSYTARDAGKIYRQTVEDSLKNQLIKMALGSSEKGLHQVIRIKSEFANEWTRFLNSPEINTGFNFQLSKQHFPYMFRDHKIKIDRLGMLVRLTQPQEDMSLKLKVQHASQQGKVLDLKSYEPLGNQLYGELAGKISMGLGQYQIMIDSESSKDLLISKEVKGEQVEKIDENKVKDLQIICFYKIS